MHGQQNIKTNQNVTFLASFLDVSFSYVYILIPTNSSSKPILNVSEAQWNLSITDARGIFT